ncbi:hypothetical protein BBD42_27110 [Paenibacillus sp. BIHB 4019]|uniref:Mannosyl-glycoprotein endo-beta-N-acetylglucosamidase-like domain-containing protein n=1 Tax=Paenibacillus sp. BIHB 4019 TaxID=1870819 RepID=A0A1B2DPW2_9BACL|nr:glucosaminidase domain-containing protein [Paenibacillus sp. BIHB 4019]ANY69754.1 hypothetical protein BBD42_27110 [Paenibacillus sp. BIHB 4019]
MAAMTRQQFIAALVPAVIQVRREGSPMLPSVRLAQYILETGGVIHSWYNLGGIKALGASPNAYWQGQAVIKGTWEHVDGRNINTSAAFRAYSSVYHFMKDQDLLFMKARYDRVRLAKTPEEQAQMLLACGYATDPAYAAKLIAIINSNGLRQYDNEAAAAVKTTVFKGAKTVPILQGGMVEVIGYERDGTVWVPARALGSRLGGKIGWTGSKVTVNGKELESLLDGGTGYVTMRALAASLNKKIEWEPSTRTVTII